MKCQNRIDVRTADGFTLAELVIALGLMSVVLAVMVAFFMTAVRLTPLRILARTLLGAPESPRIVSGKFGIQFQCPVIKLRPALVPGTSAIHCTHL